MSDKLQFVEPAWYDDKLKLVGLSAPIKLTLCLNVKAAARIGVFPGQGVEEILARPNTQRNCARTGEE
jgi:hypothetical protein